MLARSIVSARRLVAALALLACTGERRRVRPAARRRAGAAGSGHIRRFTIFLRGAPIGTEQIALTRIADGWTIASSGRLGAPLDIVARRSAGALHRRLEAASSSRSTRRVRGQAQTIHTVQRDDGDERRSRRPVRRREKTDTIDAERRC